MEEGVPDSREDRGEHNTFPPRPSVLKPAALRKEGGVPVGKAPISTIHADGRPRPFSPAGVDISPLDREQEPSICGSLPQNKAQTHSFLYRPLRD